MTGSLVLLAAGGGASIMKVNPGLTFFTIVTFLLVALILRFTAWKPIMATLDERERTIREAIESAKKERAEAEKLLVEQKQAIAEARREAAELIRKNQADVEAARQQALATARKDAEELLVKARKTIDEERAKAVAEVRGIAVDLGISVAQKLLETNLDEQKQRKLAEDFIGKLPQAPRA